MARTAGPEPFGCVFDRKARLFTTDVGSQSIGATSGQLILWFPPYDVFPGAPAPYPNGSISDNFCKIAVDIGTAGQPLIDKKGRLRYWWYGELNWNEAGGQRIMAAKIEELLAEDT